MCRASTTACSRYTAGSPNAASASRIAAPSASGSSAGVPTRRMPRPPPPATALTNTGNSMAPAASTRIAGSALGSLEAITGSPAARAAAIALALFPASFRMSAGGPTKVIPARAQPSARSGFSDRNPYPG